jgi:hypothetical protein
MGSTATLGHKLASAISVELGNGAKKFEKFLPVLCIQCRDKASINKNEFRKVTIQMKRMKLVSPSGREMR